MMRGALLSRGVMVQRQRIVDSIQRVDPVNPKSQMPLPHSAPSILRPGTQLTVVNCSLISMGLLSDSLLVTLLYGWVQVLLQLAPCVCT